ncbi:TetR/AcrR family transcriptional regulator [Pontibacter cellulosilyticus]|uniref:TetR/AcrR family transcriptional regulator n=1 Tax=Pontibacter cellulosilyticus TaxID=1720253 RepID=A0A923SMS7_9BACT|nr:TetR/AcrR family transcriptional regulator [Pontibacter cellulosilyticus]MBC5992485.1 TetR/AcrR family transcriptional regulator [Pontibacter cellulosilyticus]
MEAVTSKAERTRQLIIEKAAHLFNQKGFAGTSMQDIMAATGLTKGGIYGHFESKEEIALAAFEHATSFLTRLIAEKLAAHTSATSKLDALLTFYRNYLLTPPIIGGCPVLNTSVEADDTNQQLRASVVKVLNRLHKAVANIVSQGIKQGEFKADVDAERFAVLFISVVEGGIMVSKAYGDTKYLNIVLQHLEQIIASELKV